MPVPVGAIAARAAQRYLVRGITRYTVEGVGYVDNLVLGGTARHALVLSRINLSARGYAMGIRNRMTGKAVSEVRVLTYKDFGRLAIRFGEKELIVKRRHFFTEKVIDWLFGGGDDETNRRLGLPRNLTNNLNSIGQNTMANLANGIKPTMTVDTRVFDAAIREYAKWTKKDFQTIVNQKLYWVLLNTVRNTEGVNKLTIDQEMNSTSRVFKNLTVAEAIILDRARKKGETLTKGQLKQKAKRLIRVKKLTSGWTRTGWFPAIREVAPYAEVKSATRSGARLTKRDQKGKDKGRGFPVRASNSDVVIARAVNNIEADNDPKARYVMERALARGLDIEARSMMDYVRKKIEKSNAKFNQQVK